MAQQTFIVTWSNTQCKSKTSKGENTLTTVIFSLIVLAGKLHSTYFTIYFILHFRSDNDQYGHINNSIYYHLFDSIVNQYLIEHCDQSPQDSQLIGLVAESFCKVNITSANELCHATFLTHMRCTVFCPTLLSATTPSGLASLQAWE